MAHMFLEDAMITQAGVYAEFRGWLQDRYAEYGKTSTFFR
jgi:hypothetical protein